MATLQTPRGKLHYRSRIIYPGFKQINRDVAFENLKVLVDVLQKAGITVSPAFGSLLGIIRENNFIEWDEDIDLFILKEDLNKLLNVFWDLREVGFELIRVDRCGYLYSIMRNSEYIDFYIMENISPEVRTGYGEGFMFEQYLTDLIDWDFRGIAIKVPKDFENCLEFLYGDWRTPCKYLDFKMSKIQVLKLKIWNWVKNQLPYSLRFRMMKRHHRKDLDKFLEKCKKKGVSLQYAIEY